MHYKLPVLLLSIISVFWLIGSSYCYVCNVRGNCNSVISEEKDETQVDTKALPVIVIEDGDSLSIEVPGQLGFLYGTDSLVNFRKNEVAWNQLSEYLLKYPEKNLVVTGHYDSSEIGGAQLGLNRSAAFIEYFTQDYNVGSPNRFKSAFKPHEGLLLSDDSSRVNRALSFAFNVDKSKIEDKSEIVELKTLEVDLLKARLVYFDFGSAIMKADPALHQFFSDLKYFLNQENGAKILLTGHTDNVGTPEKNKRLSRERAKDVRQYLKDNYEFSESDFVLEAKGENKPIAKNDSEDGRAKNRRVEIKLANY